MIRDLLDKPLNEELRELKKAFKDAGVEGSLVDYLDTMELAAEELVKELEALTAEPETVEELEALEEEVKEAKEKLVAGFDGVDFTLDLSDMAETAADEIKRVREEVESAGEALSDLWGYKRGVNDLETLISVTVDGVEAAKKALGGSGSLSAMAEEAAETITNAIDQIRDQLGLSDTDKDRNLSSLICRLSARSGS